VQPISSTMLSRVGTRTGEDPEREFLDFLYFLDFFNALGSSSSGSRFRFTDCWLSPGVGGKVSSGVNIPLNIPGCRGVCGKKKTRGISSDVDVK
jgi:hypothetical protein